MTLLADALPDSAPLGRDLLERVREERSSSDAAERRILELAVEWAHANPALPGQESWEPTTLPVWTDGSTWETDPEDVEWFGLPSLRWDAPAAFAAANSMSTTAGKAVIRDALVLVRRTPRFWKVLDAGLVTAWQAREVAQALLGQHDDVCRAVETAILERVRDGVSVGRVVLARLVDEAKLRLHAEERELDQIEALDRRHVTIETESINHTGIVGIEAAADWADAAPFDETLTAIAEAIKDLPEHQHESLSVRRSIALGIIADPARAQAVLDGRPDAAPTRRRELVADLHLTEAHLLLADPVITDADLRAHLTQVIQQWLGRSDTTLTIRGIRHCGGTAGGCTDCPAGLDCEDHPRHAREDYLPTDLDKQILRLANPRCVHPHCTRPARRCDCDHIRPFDPDHPGRGPTCPTCNLAPLCRHHHRLKTHAGWRYWKLDPTTYLWTDPHGLLYLRTRDGTRTLDA